MFLSFEVSSLVFWLLDATAYIKIIAQKMLNGAFLGYILKIIILAAFIFVKDFVGICRSVTYVSEFM